MLLQARNPGDPAREDELRAFADRIGVSTAQLRCVDALTETLDERVLEGADALLVGGSGDYSVVDPAPVIERFITFLGDVARQGYPTFASCFGFQAMVVGLGGTVIHDEPNAEVGTYALETLPDAAGDPVFGALPRTFMAQLGHKDRVTVLPDCCQNLARSERVSHQAYRVVGKPIYATQFHPELTWQENRARFERYMKQYGYLFGDDAQRQLDSHKPSPESNELLARFVDVCLLGAGAGR